MSNKSIILIILIGLYAIRTPIVLAQPQEVQTAVSQLITISKALAILGFVASLLLYTVYTLIMSRVRGFSITISIYSLVLASAFLILLFTLESVYNTISNIVGLKSQYEIAIKSVETRVENAKNVLNNLGITSSVLVTLGNIMRAGGEKAVDVLSQKALSSIRSNIASKFPIKFGALAVVVYAIGLSLATIGEQLLFMFSTLISYFTLFGIGLYSLLFLLKFFGELPVWFALAMLGLSLSTFKPLRGLGGGLFATMMVFGIGLPLVINIMEFSLYALGLPYYKAEVCGIDVAHASPLDILVGLGGTILLNPGQYILCIVEAVTKIMIIPTLFYSIGVGILTGGAIELSRWLSESAVGMYIASTLSSVVRRV